MAAGQSFVSNADNGLVAIALRARNSLAQNMQTLHGLLKQLKIDEQRQESYGSRLRAA